MAESLTDQLARLLRVDPEQAGLALQSIVTRIREELEREGRAEVEGLGVLRAGKDRIDFEAAPPLVQLVNARYGTLEPVVVDAPEPPRTYRKEEVFLAAPPPPEPEPEPQPEPGREPEALPLPLTGADAEPTQDLPVAEPPPAPEAAPPVAGEIFENEKVFEDRTIFVEEESFEDGEAPPVEEARPEEPLAPSPPEAVPEPPVDLEDELVDDLTLMTPVEPPEALFPPPVEPPPFEPLAPSPLDEFPEEPAEAPLPEEPPVIEPHPEEPPVVEPPIEEPPPAEPPPPPDDIPELEPLRGAAGAPEPEEEAADAPFEVPGVAVFPYPEPPGEAPEPVEAGEEPPFYLSPAGATGPAAEEPSPFEERFPPPAPEPPAPAAQPGAGTPADVRPPPPPWMAEAEAEAPPSARRPRRALLWIAAAALILLPGLYLLSFFFSSGSDPQVTGVPAPVDTFSTAAPLVPDSARVDTSALAAGLDSVPTPPPPPVEEPVESGDPLRASAPLYPDRGGWTWFVASLPSRAAAEAIAERYRRAGFRSGVVEAAPRGRTVYRVGIGQFADRQQALGARGDLPDNVPADAYISRIE